MLAVQVVEPQMHDEFKLVWIPRFTLTQLLAVMDAVVVFGFKRKIVITADATNDRFNGLICNGNGPGIGVLVDIRYGVVSMARCLFGS